MTISQTPQPLVMLSDYLVQFRAEMTALGIAVPEERAFFLAAMHQESVKGAGARRYVTRLASVYNNPFGVKWVERRDTGRYKPKRLDANQFDSGLYVDYRIYPTLREAIRIERVNKIERPGIYARCKAAFGGDYPGGGPIHPNWPEWIRCIARIHCNENPAHAASVLMLWREYLDEERVRA